VRNPAWRRVRLCGPLLCVSCGRGAVRACRICRMTSFMKLCARFHARYKYNIKHVNERTVQITEIHVYTLHILNGINKKPAPQEARPIGSAIVRL
jgi:hypothetical protein